MLELYTTISHPFHLIFLDPVTILTSLRNPQTSQEIYSTNMIILALTHTVFFINLSIRIGPHLEQGRKRLNVLKLLQNEIRGNCWRYLDDVRNHS